MSDYRDLNENLAQMLPEIPRYIEIRSMLMNHRGIVFGFDESAARNNVVCNRQTGLITVIGKPSIAYLNEAIAQRMKTGVVLAFDDNGSFVAEALPDWSFERAILHLTDGLLALPEVPAGAVRFLTRDEVMALQGVPLDLKEELLIEANFTQIAATIVDDKPVAFCYAGAITETLWDVSIDTLEGYRHRGYAALCVAFLVQHFKQLGKHPVWGALESNKASLNLAKKLGFKPVDSLFVFEENSKKP